ncbi:ABC transporter ATP-binding protein [Flavobacterium cheongpyeongense]|uniref:ABC transporter ATP-binding protein n=1 Tax=Flavobacterium cheongpyeongense TaxID=2212651 RepID=A0A2V4C0P9_9FLAO|nr:peptidase domain-containing ABC transporter [Flavobacterium cheongpyeongense]PXY39834.1 ABC transporter ATP-binding protein [Flavobacterium cheongpyeongense]
MRKKFPHFHQYDFMDCGPTSLKMVCKFYGKNVDLAYLREISFINGQGTTFAGLVDAAEKLGLATMGLSVTFNDLAEELPLPCIVHWRQRHYAVVYKITDNKVVVGDPANFDLITYSKKDFLKGWLSSKNINEDSEGLLLTLEPTPLFYENDHNSGIKPNLLSFLNKYFKPHRKYIAQVLSGLFFGTILQLIFPFLTQQIVDTGINTRNINFIYLILIAQIVLFISQSALNITRNWIVLHVTSRMNLRMLSDFIIKLMKLPIIYFDSRATGDILQRINDNNRIQTFLSTTTLDVLFSTLTLVVFSFILAYFNLFLFIVFIIGSSFYIAWILLFMKRRAEMDFRYFDQAASNQNTTIQLIDGMQEIKLNGSEKRRRWDWEALQTRLFKLNIKNLVLTQTQNEGGQFIDQIKNIIISFIAAKAVIDGEMTLGTMLSVQYIIGQMNVPINNFLGFIRNYQDAKLSLLRLSEIHNKADEEPLETDFINEFAGDKTMKIENLNFRYGSSASEMVLKNINMTLPEGKVTAIVGSSGSGKTTLLKLLLKFNEPTSGSIYVGNTNLKSFGFNFWRANCGAVMQDGYIFADSISRNISESDINGLIDRKKLRKASEVANIAEFIEELPNGYKTKIGSSGIGISGGQKQRILIARAVYKNPEYIFFDEATSSLDANNETIIMRNLEEFFKNGSKENKTVVVIAHRLSTVKKADQIIVLNKGEIVERGNHNELVQKKGYYFGLVKNQLELGD